MAGKMMRRNTVSGLAPSEAPASSTSGSSSISTGCTARTTNGSVTNSSASATPIWVKATLMPTGLPLPYRASSVSPATMVGRANGRSIRALTAPLPRKSSRTSTQAIRTPATALIAATTSETTSVSLSAETAWGLVIASQKPEMPSSKPLAATAASGISTTRLR